jgi:CxxC motif-containing protein (DUF1111 family)
MNQTYRVWYLLVPLVALLPAGARLLWWQRPAKHADVDAAMAKAGEVLFVHEWTPKDPLCPDGDGLGPVFNAKSCVACHHQGGNGGAGDLRFNVTTFTVRQGGLAREGVVHAQHVAGQQHRETLQHVHSTLPAVSSPTLGQVVTLPGSSNHCLSFPMGVHVSQRNTPALFGSKLIDEIPERVILAGAKAQKLKWGMAPADGEEVPVGRASRLGDGRVGRFGWKGQIASLSDFVQAACANELGLGNPGQSQPTPIYLAPSRSTKIDLTLKQCDELTAFCASLPKPVERLPKGVSESDAAAGRKLFASVGCAECHTPKLGDVDGIYSDLLLHRMGQDLVGGGSYGEPPVPRPERSDEGPSPSEWRTPPLWGVADSAPYLHDGRAPTLEDAIKMHGGQGSRARDVFLKLSPADQARLVAFLKTMKAPGAAAGEMAAAAR